MGNSKSTYHDMAPVDEAKCIKYDHSNMTHLENITCSRGRLAGYVYEIAKSRKTQSRSHICDGFATKDTLTHAQLRRIFATVYRFQATEDYNELKEWFIAKYPDEPFKVSQPTVNATHLEACRRGTMTIPDGKCSFYVIEAREREIYETYGTEWRGCLMGSDQSYRRDAVSEKYRCNLEDFMEMRARHTHDYPDYPLEDVRTTF